MDSETEAALAEADFYSIPELNLKLGPEGHLRVLAEAYRAQQAELSKLREEHEKAMAVVSAAREVNDNCASSAWSEDCPKCRRLNKSLAVFADQARKA